MPWQFSVIDGADREQVFLLPASGIVVIGSSKKHAEICLHDLYVQRTHCEVEVTPEDAVEVRNLRPVEGIFVNKARAERQELSLGDVLRIGNTHLRLDVASEGGPAPAPRAAPEETTTASAPQEPIKEVLQPAPSLPPERLAELAGHLLGHFELGELLGKGPHKAVFVAKDQKTDETVVVKVLSPRFPARPEELHRFGEVMKKALKALQLRHESLVTVRGVGRTGIYTWIACEHVPGENLAEVIERVTAGGKKPKWQSGIRLVKQIGSVLDYLHKRHIMHGHLTPRNILVNTETKEVKLDNLLLDHALGGSTLMAEIKTLRRTQDTAFLSPEQCEEGAFVDELSDQYALGALVYARMTGRPPFVGANPAETMKLIRTAPLVRPRDVNPQIPLDIEAVVIRMLSRHQEDRYVTPAALLADLETIASTS